MLVILTRRKIALCKESRAAQRGAGPRAGSGLTSLALLVAKHFDRGCQGGDGNLVFSPLSIYSALALVAAGAQGRTLRELLDALGAGSRSELAAFVRGMAERALADRSTSGGPAVAFASGLWHDVLELIGLINSMRSLTLLLPGFRATAADAYRAEARAVDFRDMAEAVSEINNWVAAATNNLVGSILDPDTRLVLASAVYFKGKWEEPFSKARTKHDTTSSTSSAAAPWTRPLCASSSPCTTGSRCSSSVPGRRHRCRRRGHRRPADRLPRYSMCVFLPDARDGLPDLLNRIASSAGFWRDHLPDKRVDVGELRLPRFRMSFSSIPMRVLTDNLRIRRVFDAEEADLSDMAAVLGGALPQGGGQGERGRHRGHGHRSGLW
ncbi:hypothetical protein ACP70R_003726 [Stipagrostis hirtigluma subsp. patula]